MSTNTVDARGMLCPKPLIMTKKALTELPTGGTLNVVLDNETARDNVFRFLEDNGACPSVSAADGVWTITAAKTAATPAAPQAEAYCRPAESPKPLVLVFRQAVMGNGSDDLGRLLIQACVNALKEVQPLPAALLFYNGGVHLTCEGSPVLAALADLESRGVKILVCGTCLDFFELKPRLKAGRISNMYDILQTIATAGTVFEP
jgi:selenium metabolism protein YedF